MITNHAPTTHHAQHIYNVAELSGKIKQLLEEKFPFIWISGEISNFRTPASGHCYFTLKDAQAQISAVMFKGQAKALKFQPEDGLAIIGLGRLSVYEPRGSYQVIFEHLEPKGVGALQIAFEKLKQTLAEQGLFDSRHKSPLPSLPRKVSIITSPTGAAVRDFIQVAHRRFPNLSLEVVPARVQGEHAPDDIVHAIGLINEMATTDLVVLARGGGSIEDLCAFNDERVARAIFASRIPVVSAIGHETDFTIADFVADLRAPTPSAAAEISIPAKNELEKNLQEINLKLYKTIINILKYKDNDLSRISERILHPQRRIQDMRLRLDDACLRLSSSLNMILTRKKEQLTYGQQMLVHLSPSTMTARMKDQLDGYQHGLRGSMQRMIRDGRTRAAGYRAMLTALNPMAILKRGYSITRTLPPNRIVRRANAVKIDQSLEILLGKGRLRVRVDDRQLDSD